MQVQNVEMVVQRPANVEPMRAVRGTLLASSFQAMRGHGLEDHYFAVLEPEYEEAMRTLIVRSWIPIQVAEAHYQAMDGIGYARSEMVANGTAVGERIQGTFLGTIMRQLKAANALNPWSMLAKMPTAWDRVFQGGAPAVAKLGPKEARMEIHGTNLTEITYFCAGLEGITLAALGLIRKTVYVRQVGRPKAGYAAFRISWV